MKIKYSEFLKTKERKHLDSGFDISESELNSALFPFQKFCVKLALKKGRFALFLDTGMGKTICQLEWANWITQKTQKPVLILAPLAVSGQTILEGKKFNIHVEKLKSDVFGRGIFITNYEQLDNIKCEQFGGVILDESSILKNFTGKRKRQIIKEFKYTPYKLACTATPAPNDYNEFGNHSEFLNVLDAQDMRARWFVRDEGMNNYRLKRHGEKDFFSWISSWAVFANMPSDLGYDDDGFILPGLEYIEKTIHTEQRNNGRLFNDIAVSATNFYKELRYTKKQRLKLVNEIANKDDQQYIIWVNTNDEATDLKKIIKGCVEVHGSEKTETKEEKLLGFASGKYRVLITKKKIAQFGLNFQNCHNQIFASLDFSFEGLYQAVRRSYRFGQKNIVDVYIITTDTMTNVIKAIKEKERQFNAMKQHMNKLINTPNIYLKMDYTKRELKNDFFHLINGDSVEEIDNFKDDSFDFILFSPPFSSLFTYSDNLRDMGNSESHKQFFENYNFLLEKLYAKLRPGRLMAVHTKDLAVYKNSSGYTGLYNFTSDNHRACEMVGFRYHSKITIWTDPVLEMQRTKTQRLLYKQLKKDSTYSGIGLPEYVTIFRKWEGIEEDWIPVSAKNEENFNLDTWQKWASPVWFDIRRTDVLNAREGTDMGDEKHIAPLQLEVIKRCILMWTNPNESVFTPFAGIGSEVYQAIKYRRYGVGIELKESYYDTAVKNCQNAIENKKQMQLF